MVWYYVLQPVFKYAYINHLVILEIKLKFQKLLI